MVVWCVLTKIYWMQKIALFLRPLTPYFSSGVAHDLVHNVGFTYFVRYTLFVRYGTFFEIAVSDVKI